MKILKLALPIAMSALVGTAVGVGTTTVLVEHAEAAAESRVAALAPASGPHVAAWVEAPVLLAAGADAPVEPDAGVDEAILTSPSLAPGDIDDPLESPGGFWADVTEARKTGWPALVVVVLFAALRLARGKVAWLREGKRAAYSAAALTILGAGVDWLAGGGTWMVAAAAVLGAVALLLNPIADLSLGGGKGGGEALAGASGGKSGVA